MQALSNLERARLTASLKLRTATHTQTLNNQVSAARERSATRRPDIFSLSKELLALRDEYRRDRVGNAAARTKAIRILETFPPYSADEDAMFVCSQRLLRVAGALRGSLLADPPASLRLAMALHTRHTFMWDAHAALGFVSVLPYLTMQPEDPLPAAKRPLLPALETVLDGIAPRIVQLAAELTPAEAADVVEVFAQVPPQVAVSARNTATIGGMALGADDRGLRGADPKVAVLKRASLRGDLQDPAALSLDAAGGGGVSEAVAGSSVVGSLSTAALLCEDYDDIPTICRFVLHAAQLAPSVAAGHMAVLADKLRAAAATMKADDVVALCSAASRARQADRRMLMAAGRRALLLLDELPIASIAAVMHAFHMCEVRHVPLLRRCATRILLHLDDMTPPVAALALSALAHAGALDEVFAHAAVRRVHRMPMDGAVFASLLQASATAGIIILALLDQCLRTFAEVQRLRDEPAGRLTSAVGSLAMLLKRDAAAPAERIAGVVDRPLCAILKALEARLAAEPHLAAVNAASPSRSERQQELVQHCMDIVDRAGELSAVTVAAARSVAGLLVKAPTSST